MGFKVKKIVELILGLQIFPERRFFIDVKMNCKIYFINDILSISSQKCHILAFVWSIFDCVQDFLLPIADVLSDMGKITNCDDLEGQHQIVILKINLKITFMGVEDYSQLMTCRILPYSKVDKVCFWFQEMRNALKRM